MRKPKRRANGMGSVYPTASGFKGQFPAGKQPSGRIKYRYVSAPTRRECEQKLQDAMYEHRHGGPVISSSETLGRYLARWVTDVAAPHVTAHTAVNYRNALGHIIDRIGAIPLRDVRSGHVQACCAELLDHYAAATVHMDHSLLCRALGDAVQWDLIPKNPAAHLQPVKVPKIERVVLSREQCGQLFAAVGDLQLRALWMVLALCGLRIGEACALHWTEVGDGELAVHGTKTAAADRVVPLPREVRMTLRTHKHAQNVRIMGSRDVYEDEDLVFSTDAGRPLRNGYCRTMFRSHLEAAGLPMTRIHDLRRTAINLMRESGVELDVVSQIVGHRSIRTTADIYGSINHARISAAGRLLDDYLKEAK